jgi:Protein of unknown function (DUF2934)
MSNTDVTERIRQRAHGIWEEEGRPQGLDLTHWLRAEREVRESLNASSSTEVRTNPEKGQPRKRTPSSLPPTKPRQRRHPKR